MTTYIVLSFDFRKIPTVFDIRLNVELSFQLIRMMITVVVFYALCWLPLHTITIIGDNNPDIYNQKHVPILWLCFHWLSMSNSCYNPIIYLWMSPKFRAGLKLTVRNCTKRKQSTCASEDEMYQKIHMMFPKLQIDLDARKTPNDVDDNKPCHMGGLKPHDYMLRGSIHSDT